MSGAKQKKPRKRLTIGFLTPWVHAPGYRSLWSGIHNTACEHDVNLICFPGGHLQSPRGSDRRNMVYDLATSETLDGAIVWSDALATYITEKEFRAFYKRYQPLPMVSIARVLRDIPSISVDNAQGMHQAITHLIETHDLTRIAFIRGPENHYEAEQRYHAYTQVLARYELPLDSDLVVTGSLTQHSGAEATRILLDQRKLEPGVSFEALVAANDPMALGALEVLQARGVQVPADVALVGFDDRGEAKYATPPLTTVRNSFYKIGAQATEMLLTQIEGRLQKKRVTLPLELVVRQSCGCPLPIVARAAARPDALPPAEQVAGTAFLSAQRDTVLSILAESMTTPQMDSQWTEQLWDAFIAQVDGEENTLVPALEHILRRTATSGADVFARQDALSALRHYALPRLSGDASSRAENTLNQARVLIGDMARRLEGQRAVQTARQAQVLHQVDAALTTRFDLAELMDTASWELPKTGIQSCYLVLFEDPGAPTGRAKLAMAYDATTKRTDLESVGNFFPPGNRCRMVYYRPSGDTPWCSNPYTFRTTNGDLPSWKQSPIKHKFAKHYKGNLVTRCKGCCL